MPAFIRLVIPNIVFPLDPGDANGSAAAAATQLLSAQYALPTEYKLIMANH
ncbi:hypothetical protein ACTHOQ_03930 [Solibacillus silvestris]|uniref:hypothetical protein n=1 Tax=Solibacillus silvestris TaxID=76853 RepID=UPI003F820F36